MKNILSLIIFFISSNFCFGQTKTLISGQVENLDTQMVLLAQAYGAEQFVIDTAKSEGDKLVFTGDEELHPGIYYLILSGNKEYKRFIINDESEITFTADASDFFGTAKVQAEDNNILENYISFIAEQRKKVEDLENDPNKTEKITVIDKQVEMHRFTVYKTFPNSVSALVLKVNESPKTLEVEDDSEESRIKQYRDYKKHYFDKIDFDDSRLIRIPDFHDKLSRYLSDFTAQQPDSVIVTLDLLLSKLKNNETAYKYYLSRWTNEYSKSRQVGMDKVYVHLMDNYFSDELTPWVEKEQLKKNKNNADFIRGNLIGSQAKPFIIQLKDQTEFNLDEIDAKYTVLIFWSPSCSHCKEELPHLEAAYSEISDLGAKVVTLCVKKDQECWDFLDQSNLPEGIIHGFGLGQNIYKDYDLRMTPRIYILDEDKTIAFKQIAIEQIPKIIKALEEEKQSN